MRIKPDKNTKKITQNGITTVLNNFSYDYRPYVTAAVFIICFVILAVNLFDIQVVKGDQLSQTVSTTKTRTLNISGTRGKILDKNGIPLAVDQKTYNLEFYRDYNTTAQREIYTNSIIKALEILDESDVEIENSFAIKARGEGEAREYYFDWGNLSEETAQKKEDRWRQDFYFSIKAGERLSPEEMYTTLRKRYHIPEDMLDAQAFRVLAIWQDSIQNYYYSRSITVAQKLNETVVSRLESYSYELAGFTVTETTKRTYPQYETASHIVGYIGRITAETADKYKELGYDTGDLVGVYGIEQKFESYLTGNGKDRSGQRVVETTASGTILRELSYTAPGQGDNVYLTIDINMQKIAEAALAENIEAIHAAQTERYNDKKEKYQKIEEEIGRSIKMAETGSVVVMQVNTGAVLAMASYPWYDPNSFVSGISSADMEQMLGDKRGILVNKAISSASTPGSIFKMVVGAAGLSEGVLTVGEKIEDKGEYTKYVEKGYTGPRCWRWRDSHKTHGSINLAEAIMHSCNYFFYEVADRLGIDNIRKWAGNFGLLSKTNIELSGEAKGQVGNQQVLFDISKGLSEQETSMPYIVNRSIKNSIIECAEKSGMEKPADDVLDDAALRMMTLIDLTRSERLAAVRSILVGELGLKKSVVDYETKFHICDYVEELIWTPLKTVNSGIGQGITTLTPIAVARYISAIVNGGTVYDAHVVDRVVNARGETVYKTEPSVYKQLNIDPAYLFALKEGMNDVVAGEQSTTAQKYFKNFKYKSEMGGKTGTAQVNTIDIENNSWFVAFVPYEKPEIAISVCIPNGYAGAMSSITVKAIVEYYLDLKYKQAADDIPAKDALNY